MKFAIALFISLIFIAFNTTAHGIILLGKGNTANLTDPETGVPFDSVALVSDGTGGSKAGSAVYLGNRYMLTADHVFNRSHVTFDGSTFYERDTSFTPVQVAAGVDMKIFKLKTTPTVDAVNLLETATEQAAAATLIGWGVGRATGEAIGDTSVTWGSASTTDKRWGVNEVLQARPLAYELNSENYSYEVVTTVLGSDNGIEPGLGDNEAALSSFDSGGALFQNISGTWYLIGLNAVAEGGGISTYGLDSITAGGDENYFARISTYSDEIMAVIPEPQAYAFIMASLTVLLLITRRRLRLS